MILSEGHRVVEEENHRLVQRSVEIETLAAEATKECERLTTSLQEAENELNSLRKAHEDLGLKLKKDKNYCWRLMKLIVIIFMRSSREILIQKNENMMK